jgi:hypothetical protein
VTLSGLQIAFVSSVQAQFISFTWERNDNPTQEAINALAFLALLLNLAGVVLGQMQILNLNRERAVLEATSSYMNSSIASIEQDIQELQIQLGHLSHDSSRPMVLDRHAQQMFTSAQRRIQAAVALTNEVRELSRTSEISGVDLIQKRVGLEAGNIASGCMIWGIQLFGASLSMFAISTQPKKVWIPVVSVFGTAVVLYYLLRLFAEGRFQFYKERQRKRQNPLILREEPEQAKIAKLEAILSDIADAVSCECSRYLHKSLLIS